MPIRFNVQKAAREDVYTKIALMGPSGSGKTFSALRLATGMAKEIEKETGRKAKILFGNTEGSRGKYYANEFDYDIVTLEPPYNPETFVDFIDFAVEEGYDILILDSSSAEWEGKGGCLELHQQAGGKYQDWSKVTHRHDKFINALANSSIHIIATMRGKDQYEIEKDDRGKTSVKKLGVGAKQRDGFEYEFTVTFSLDTATHMATIQKDNTHIFDLDPTVILTEDHGKRIIQWANDGENKNNTTKNVNGETNNPTSQNDNSTIELESIKNNISELTKLLVNNGVARNDISDIIKKYHFVSGKPSANYNTISNIEVAKSVLSELENIKG